LEVALPINGFRISLAGKRIPIGLTALLWSRREQSLWAAAEVPRLTYSKLNTARLTA
jgi:hypothetical protein